MEHLLESLKCNKAIRIIIGRFFIILGKLSKPIHLCESCIREFPTCLPEKVLFGIDINPNARNKEADMIVECSGYKQKQKEPDSETCKCGHKKHQGTCYAEMVDEFGEPYECSCTSTEEKNKRRNDND